MSLALDDLPSHVLDALREGCQVIGRNFTYLYLNDAAAAQGPPPTGSGDGAGCGCRIAGEASPLTGLLASGLALIFLLRRRRSTALSSSDDRGVSP